MASFKLRKIVKYSIASAIVGGTVFSLHANQYQLDSIGIVRLSRAAYTVYKIGKVYKRELYGQNVDRDSPEYLKIKSRCHQQGAEELLKLCCLNKGVYVKVGQHIAALEYLLPSEYVQTMKILHSRAPKSNLNDIYRVIREDLKADVQDIFAKLEPEPIGSASLAQVHKAILKDGTVVAVKVQHPSVLGNSRVDMKTMEYLVQIVAWVFPEFKFQWLVNESKKNIRIELDFEHEGHNAEKLAEMFKNTPWLKIPKIRWDLTTERILTMEFVEGGQVNDLKYIQENKINPFEVSDKLGRLYSEMIFVNGFVHSDPHPGNILVKKNEKGSCDIILLDHGLYATLHKGIMLAYANLWLSILNRDRVSMKYYATKLGLEENMYGIFACMITGRTWDSITSGIEKKKQTIQEKQFFQDQIPNLLPQIVDVLNKVNRQLLLIFKTNDLMRGIDHTLQTTNRMGSFKVMTECCIKSVYCEKIDSARTTLQSVNKPTGIVTIFTSSHSSLSLRHDHGIYDTVVTTLTFGRYDLGSGLVRGNV
ncbi:hypothetical protein Trydic_g21653 [Trypoxylus dichotomus]